MAALSYVYPSALTWLLHVVRIREKSKRQSAKESWKISCLLFFNLEINVEITCETIALSSPEAPCYRICHHVMRNWALWRQSNKRWATLNIFDKKPSLARMNCRVHEGDVPKNTKDSEYSIFKCFTSNQEEEKVFQIQKFALNLHEMCQPYFLIFSKWSCIGEDE